MEVANQNMNPLQSLGCTHLQTELQNVRPRHPHQYRNNTNENNQLQSTDTAPAAIFHRASNPDSLELPNFHWEFAIGFSPLNSSGFF